jgi:hypothetical protein
VADVTYRKARESYELAITLAAAVSPDASLRFPDMSDKQRQQIIDSAHLWSQIAQTHALLSLCDRLTRQTRRIDRALAATGLIKPGEAQMNGANVEDEYELEDAGE